MSQTQAASETVEAPAKRLYTYDELVAEFPESNQPCELWDGEIVMAPAPSFFHQEVAFRCSRQLHAFVAKRKLGKVVFGPIDMVLSPHRVTQPDIVFVAND